MGIGEEDVRKIARLARLRLEADEVGRFQGQLGKILEAMEDLRKLDTAAVEPTASVLELGNVLREDEARPFPGVERLLENAPEREGPYYKVKKVIE